MFVEQYLVKFIKIEPEKAPMCWVIPPCSWAVIFECLNFYEKLLLPAGFNSTVMHPRELFSHDQRGPL